MKNALTFGLSLALIICFSIVTFVIDLSQHDIKIDSKIENLLPESGLNDVENAAIKQLSDGAEQKIILLFVAEQNDKVSILNILSEASSHFKGSRHWKIADTSSIVNETDNYIENLARNKFHLIEQKHKKILENSTVEHAIQTNLNALLQPGGWQSPISFNSDPLNLFGNWVNSLNNAHNLSITQNGVIGTQKEQSFGLIILELNPLSHSLKQKEYAVEEVETFLSTSIESENIEAYKSGVIFHTNEAAKRAKTEISTISIGTIAGIIIFFVLVFKSLKPLIVSIMTILVSLLSAFSITHSVFGYVHIISLVFGASLIGVSIDYSIHFFSSLYFKSSKNDTRIKTSEGTRQRIFPAITLALITTSVSYLCLTQSGLSVLAQVALFSASGLITSWLIVNTIYVLLDGERKPVMSPIFLIANLPFTLWKDLPSKTRFVWAIAVTILIVTSVYSITFSNDIRALHKPSKQIVNSMLQVSNYVTTPEQNTFLVVSGNSSESVLINEENISDELALLKNTGKIENYTKLSDHVPSAHRQNDNYRFVRDELAYLETAKPTLQNIGISQEAIFSHFNEFESADGSHLSFDKWLKIAPTELKKLWLGEIDGQYYSIIQLTRIHDQQALVELANTKENLRFVSRINDISNALRHYTQRALLFLFATYLFAVTILCAHYRSYIGFVLVIPPLSATSFILCLLNVFSIELTLFHVFGLYLVLGLGIDYSLFLHETYNCKQGQHYDTQTAVLLSVVTSCLSFGLMTLSSTPMIQAFGFTILVGSTINFLTSPIVVNKLKESCEGKH